MTGTDPSETSADLRIREALAALGRVLEGGSVSRDAEVLECVEAVADAFLALETDNTSPTPNAEVDRPS